MILVWVLVIAVLVGYLRGGRFRHYLRRPLHWLGCPIAAFALEAMIPLWQRLPVPQTLWLGCMVLAQYALLLLFCYRNRCFGVSMLLIGAASLCNLAAMCCNGFRMPISPAVYDYPVFASFVARVAAGELPEYVIVGYDAPLWFLGDVLPVPYVLPGMASVGDLLLGAGVFILVQRLMGLGKAPETAAGHTPGEAS